ncbi:hypothetical protein PRIPAC_73132 [Pristionchus pacificus]|uniref:Uncharacterized protein n=1 Tax=Pristionchus pacificus TaxID=54126 RepID=A0A2A6C041_PRIPA|nr:hypothetical protein PRIPAC_73132 [Pristionchus pacificus]|eukprot:PDM71457.1 hypothetical protein PRIPAC_37864 [Pristionchus pacificus]
MFAVHSLNCIVTKLVLIGCHKGMRQRFLLLFFKPTSSSIIIPIKRDAEREAREYIDHMRAAWDSVPVKGEKTRGKWKMYKAMKKISTVSVSASQ